MSAPRILWKGKVDGVDLQVVGVGDAIGHADSYVATPEGEAVDSDELASRAYATAFLEARAHLDRLYERDMGNLNLKSGLDALEGVGAFLGKD